MDLRPGRNAAAGVEVGVVIRKHLALAFSLILVLSGSATASGALRADASPRVVRDAPECGGKGFSKLLLSAGGSFGCVHTAGDVFDTRAAAQAQAMGIKPAAAKVPCYGDGTSGPRIQIVYGYHAGLPNRGAAVTKQVREQIAPRMQAVINGQANGRDVGMRFTMTKKCGAVDVKVIKFPRDVQYGSDEPGNPGDQLVAAAKYLDKIGYNRDDRKYQILWDGWNVGACGIGFLNAGGLVDSQPINPGADGLPTLGGHGDPGTLFSVGSTKYSMVFNHAGGPHGGSCFIGQSLSTVTTEVHELFHNLGAVQLDAPHANTGHCDDAPSIMCPGGNVGYGLGINNPTCAKVIVETLDCGEDDYWNTNPKVGSYLSTHLNIAKSQFFGSQPQDDLINLPL